MTTLWQHRLTLRNVNYGRRETPWSLYPLLFFGGASTNIRDAEHLINSGGLGSVIAERLPLVNQIYDSIQGSIASGGSRHTAKKKYTVVRHFYAWADTQHKSPTFSSVEKLYNEWCDYLIVRQRTGRKIDSETICDRAQTLAWVLDQALELNSGLYYASSVKRIFGTKPKNINRSETTNFSKIIIFGEVLLDFTRSLSIEAIRGALPIRINFRNGSYLDEWARLNPPSKVKTLICEDPNPKTKKLIERTRAAWSADSSWRTRHPVMNLRIEAELLIFIAQTQMNLAQAYKLRTGSFSYQSHLNGYQVRRVYKDRRGGEAEFEIFSEYRVHFESYLAWRNELFPDNKFLFPLSSPQKRSVDVAPNFSAIRARCLKLSVCYFGPRDLRKAKVNWLLRNTKNPEVVAEMAQHSVETLLRCYEEPSHQIALVEITRFHSLSTPMNNAPGPGVCAGSHPLSIYDKPKTAPKPDCISPSGCLFCEHQRDLDCLDHVWSLASYRHYKILELSRYRTVAISELPNPVTATIDKLTQKLKQFKSSSAVRALWVEEALQRIAEGDFHLKWDGFIRLLEP